MNLHFITVIRALISISPVLAVIRTVPRSQGYARVDVNREEWTNLINKTVYWATSVVDCASFCLSQTIPPCEAFAFNETNGACDVATVTGQDLAQHEGAKEVYIKPNTSGRVLAIAVPAIKLAVVDSSWTEWSPQNLVCESSCQRSHGQRVRDCLHPTGGGNWNVCYEGQQLIETIECPPDCSLHRLDINTAGAPFNDMLLDDLQYFMTTLSPEGNWGSCYTPWLPPYYGYNSVRSFGGGSIGGCNNLKVTSLDDVFEVKIRHVYTPIWIFPLLDYWVGNWIKVQMRDNSANYHLFCVNARGGQINPGKDQTLSLKCSQHEGS